MLSGRIAATELGGGALTGRLEVDTEDDGISFNSFKSGAGCTSPRASAGGPAKLDAWIDFNGDGSFERPGGTNFSPRVDVAAGDNELSFAVPAPATPGESSPALGQHRRRAWPTGPAADGEVEDFSLTVLGPSRWRFRTAGPISTSAERRRSRCRHRCRWRWRHGCGRALVTLATSIGTRTTAPRTHRACPSHPQWLDYTASVTADEIDGDGDIDIVGIIKPSGLQARLVRDDGAENFTPPGGRQHPRPRLQRRCG